MPPRGNKEGRLGVASVPLSHLGSLLGNIIWKWPLVLLVLLYVSFYPPEVMVRGRARVSHGTFYMLSLLSTSLTLTLILSTY